MESWQGRNIVFEGRIFSVTSGLVRLENGEQAQRDVVAHPGGVAIVAEEGGDLLFVRQFRIAVEETLLELPAGIVEPDDTPALRAAAELREETGFEAGEFLALGRFYVSPGYTTEAIHLFLATGLRHVGRQLEDEEQIELVRLPRESARQMLLAGSFNDAKTIIGLHAYFSRLDAGPKAAKIE